MDDYDLELEKVKEFIRESGAKRVLVQLPDGLKPKAEVIEKELSLAFPEVELFFWLGSNFGACDIPLDVEKEGFDLLIHYGHSEWRF